MSNGSNHRDLFLPRVLHEAENWVQIHGLNALMLVVNYSDIFIPGFSDF